ncbi:VWA domain-containing protein [Actinomadura sp. KC345]|uniref:VWA domain-containing protein n=1 Tax=Actinomadura sp. KC345 TaxID=2530371 RepID=UPI001043E71A|nr:VWA domain-containing protein [Actinomadura sp. KC345]TDC58748.1 VWA domain-containing protein [Actinomadura sp. KC345]
MTSSRRRRLLWGLAVTGVLAVAAGVAVYVVKSIPQYRTTFLVDASVTEQADFQAVRRSVVSAAQNAGERDAMALRRFGGECGNADNTRSLVGSGIGNGEEIGAAARALTARGKATLGSGVLAAIDDFAGRHPFRGREGNRIIVVTGHGTDACDGDPAELGRRIRSRAGEVGVEIDMRFVGYKVPAAGRSVLGRLATTAGQPAPDFPQDGTELAATLKRYTVPTSTDPKQITLPAKPVTTRPCTLEHRQRGWKKTSRPSRFELPEQVRLPAGAAVYEVPHHPSGSGASRFVAEAGKATCSSGPPGEPSEGHYIGARVQKLYPEGPEFNDPAQMSWVGLTVEDPDASCYLFPKNPAPQPGYVAANCETVAAAMWLADREEVTTGNPRYKAALSREPGIGNWQRVPGSIEVALAVDRPGPENPAILCVQPKSRASLCTAALTFHFVETMKEGLPKDRLEAGVQQIERFMSKSS